MQTEVLLFLTAPCIVTFYRYYAIDKGIKCKNSLFPAPESSTLMSCFSPKLPELVILEGDYRLLTDI
jgi:hypothetical protein